MSKKLINGLKYEKLTEEQLYDLSQWELVDIILAYRNELLRKEQECEELKDLNTRLDNQREAYWKEYQKLKQTLTEIKSILEFYANSKMGEEQPDRTYKIMLSGGYIMAYDPKPARQALQKISEVLE